MPITLTPISVQVLLLTTQHAKMSVTYLKTLNFSRLSLEEKIAIKTAGRPTPEIDLSTKGISHGRQFTRKFKSSTYKEYDWLCGCDETNRLFCFVCILYGGSKEWTETGVFNIVNLTGKKSGKLEKHANSTDHKSNVVDLAMLGTTNIMASLNSAYRDNIARRNEMVRKNRDVLSKIVDCVKFCGRHELPLRGNIEKENSDNPGVFLGLIEFASNLDTSLKSHIESASVFKGTSATIQNELLESILHVCRDNIVDEISKSEFIAILSDGTTDASEKTQVNLVLRYVLDGKPVERFWGIFNPTNEKAETLCNLLDEELKKIIKTEVNKLIAQCYDGANNMSGCHNGLQTKIKALYKYAYFVHCYAHQLNLILKQATSVLIPIRRFFNDMDYIPTYFSKSPQRLEVLKTCTGGKTVPRPSQTRWNFHSRVINVIYEKQAEIKECCEKLSTSYTEETGNGAVAILRSLEDPDNQFWLEFFHPLMAEVDILYSTFQLTDLDPTKASRAISHFKNGLQKIRDNIDDIPTIPSNKRSNRQVDKQTTAKEACDIVLMQCTERYKVHEHLIASRLLYISEFSNYDKSFPSDLVNSATDLYPMIDKDRLITELKVLYGRKNFCSSNRIIDLLGVIESYGLTNVLSEVVKLIKILLTTPMTTSESERVFSTLKRVKTLTRSKMGEDRLCALIMMTQEQQMLRSIPDFNERVINHFAASKNRRMDFNYKL